MLSYGFLLYMLFIYIRTCVCARACVRACVSIYVSISLDGFVSLGYDVGVHVNRAYSNDVM